MPLTPAASGRDAAYNAAHGGGLRTISIWANPAATNAVLMDKGLSADISGDSYQLWELDWTSPSSTVLIEMAGHLALSSNDSAGWGTGKLWSGLRPFYTLFRRTEKDAFASLRVETATRYSARPPKSQPDFPG